MTIPAEHEIQETIALLKARLLEPGMNKPVNRAIKEGYNMAVDILAQNQRSYDGIETLRTVQGRAIAEMSVDYLAGEYSQKVLVNVPLKGQQSPGSAEQTTE